QLKCLTCLFCSVFAGVFGESVSVMEGDSVTLHTDLTKIHKHDDILWYFGPKMDLVAKIFSTCDGPEGRFRNRLKLSNQTGSLTITNTTTEHAGVYQLSLSVQKPVHVVGVFGESVSVMEGDSVTLNTDVTEIHQNENIVWKFGAEKFLIAKIYREKQIVDGRFRDRLKLDHQTGSLTITNITTQHTGLYEVKIGGARRSTKTFSVSVYGALLIAVALGIFCICRKQRKREQQGKGKYCSLTNIHPKKQPSVASA
uniref:Ig-like domain-containing protein n=1 Tax=Sinocyclocheilus anshuiensis TaxID=1608454 RepID=A0A671R141_9TELE